MADNGDCLSAIRPASSNTTKLGLGYIRTSPLIMLIFTFLPDLHLPVEWQLVSHSRNASYSSCSLSIHRVRASLPQGDWSRAGKIPPVCYSLDVRPWSFFSSSVAGYGQSACYFGECVLALVLTRADGHRSTLAQQIACIRAADMLEL